jgi:hypothetical protein
MRDMLLKRQRGHERHALKEAERAFLKEAERAVPVCDADSDSTRRQA